MDEDIGERPSFLSIAIFSIRGNEMSEFIHEFAGVALSGRRKIFTSVEEITAENVVVEVNRALRLHFMNFNEEEYLFWYRRGIQPILGRVKEVRPEINNKIVVNNANQVAIFKNGYFLTKPATYVSRKKDEAIVNKVKELNEYVYASGKPQADNEVVNWFHTVGVGAIYVKPNKDDTKPFEVYALDPRSAFVVYSLNPGNEPVMGISMVTVDETKVYIDVYTKTKVFRVLGSLGSQKQYQEQVTAIASSVMDVQPNVLGEIPIVEYQYDENRMGSFEVAIPLMNSINLVESNRLDGIEQFVQSLVVLYNCELEEGQTANTIRENGLICLKSNNGDANKADIKVLSEELDQIQTQTTLDNLYEQVCDKCGMPYISKNSGGTSDNGSAVYLRNGYQQADTAARTTTDLFKKSNAYFDRIVLAILKKKHRFELNPADFELYIEHNTVSNLLVKTQAALNMKSLGLAPQIALERSGLSNDPLTDIELSKDYIFETWKPSKKVEKIAEDKPMNDGSGEQDNPPQYVN